MDTTVADPLVGQVLDGRYRIESRIARGGMATVYVARDIKLDRVIALKVMHANLAQDDDFVRRFIGEAKAAAALSHPNVVAVYDQGTDGQHVFLAMEYVAGRTLRDFLTQRGRLGPREALEVMQPVLSALGAAHRAGLVHRDVKPENVLLTPDGQAKVADFGLARAETASKQTKTGMIIGTVGYLAPEQVLSGQADVRSDVYAAGIMLFELLTGRQPHTGDTPLAVAYRHVNDVVPPPSSMISGLPQQIDTLVIAATSREPGRRPADANQFLALVGEVYGAMPRDIDRQVEYSGTSVLQQPAPFAPAPAAAGPSPGSQTRIFQPGTMPTESAVRVGPMDRLISAITGKYVLIAIGALAAVILGWAVWYQTSGQYQHVPDNIVGMKVEDARQQLGSSGLKVVIGKSIFDEKTPKDRVAQVTPAPGERVAEGDTVTLIPSKGRQPIPVPDVRNKTLEDAKQTLRDGGFTLGDEVTEPSRTIAKDRVIRTDPKAGEKQSPDQPVGIVISAGMSMPDLTGRDGDESANLLRSMGLNVDVDERDDGSKLRNTVLEQDPQPGTTVSRGDRVRIVVNKKDCSIFGINNPFCDQNDGDQNGGQNQDQIQVPGTLGRPVSEAVAILQSAGFQVNVQRRFGSGRVVGQNPLTGTAPRNSVITIFQ